MEENQELMFKLSMFEQQIQQLQQQLIQPGVPLQAIHQLTPHPTYLQTIHCVMMFR